MKTSIIVLSLLLAVPATALELVREWFGNDPVGNEQGWVKGVLDAVNLKSRVYAQGVTIERSFYYRGNADDLNDTLKKYAAIKTREHRLILLPGNGKAQSPSAWAGRDGVWHRDEISFNWQLDVGDERFADRYGETAALMTVYVNGRKPHAPQDEKAIANSLRELDDTDFKKREKAKQELEQLGYDAKPFLRQALKGPIGLEIRRCIESLLGKVPDINVTELNVPNGIEIVTMDDLLAAYWQELKGQYSSMPHGSNESVNGLSRFALYDDKVVPYFTEMLQKRPSAFDRQSAAYHLGSLGVLAKSAIPMLKKGLADPDPHTRECFQTALTQIEEAKDQPGLAERRRRELAIAKEIAEFKKASGTKK
jgi:hypothetical protein